MNPLRRPRRTDGAARDEVREVRSERDVPPGPVDDSTRPFERIDPAPARDRYDDRTDPYDRRDPYDRTDPRYDDRAGVRHDDRHDDRHDTQPVPESTIDRAAVVARERAAFGGVKLGSAFFGWLTALGTAVLLTALVAAAATAVRVASGRGLPADASTLAAGTGLRTDVAIIVILFVAYYCGGYVAGRMARFDGAKQGFAVWVIALVAALLIATVGAIAGAGWDLLGTLNGFPRLQSGSTTVTRAGVVVTLIALVAALVGAVLGGLAGMRFHRRVDRAGLGR